MDVKPGKRHNTNKAALGLLASCSAHVEQLAHYQAQVASHGCNQVAFLNLLETAQPASPGTARFADMSETPFHPFTPQALQSLASRPSRATSIVEHSPAFLLRHIPPVACFVYLPLRLGNVGSDAQRVCQFQGVCG